MRFGSSSNRRDLFFALAIGDVGGINTIATCAAGDSDGRDRIEERAFGDVCYRAVSASRHGRNRPGSGNHQTRQRALATIACPGLHANAVSNSGMLLNGPLTRYWLGECSFVSALSLRFSGRSISQG